MLHGTLGGDGDLLQSTRQAILGRANAKRTPSNVDVVQAALQKKLCAQPKSALLPAFFRHWEVVSWHLLVFLVAGGRIEVVVLIRLTLVEELCIA